MKRCLALLLLTILAGADRLEACAPAPRAGERVGIADESAIIVWDPEAQVEELIRRATFQGSAGDFGFLVPTPATPMLTETEDAVFDLVTKKTARPVERLTTRKIDWTPVVFKFMRMSDRGATTGAPVEVLSEAKVAGYDAVIISATDVVALKSWLEQNGYPATPGIERWLEPYVRDKWTITAFKIDKDANEAARSRAVRMSFLTTRPVFPYREPAAEQPLSSRVLRIWFFGPERVRGVLGTNTFWAGTLEWANPVDETFRTELSKASGVNIPIGTRLTHFLDTTTGRGNEDLYFTRDVSQSDYRPPPRIVENGLTTEVPADLIVVSFLITMGIVRWMGRRKRA